jgi:anti-sigma factor RsiW
MEHPTEELSLYLDGQLDEPSRGRVEAHLVACDDCRGTLEALRALVRRAGSLDDTPPGRDLWPGIAARIGDVSLADVVPLAPRRRRVSFSIPELAAAAVALMLVSAGGVWLASRPGSQVGVARTGGPRAAVTLTAGEQGLPPAYASYDAAIRDLEATLEARRPMLDTATIRVVEQSLRVIDLAIAQARAALAEEPDNSYLNSHLAAAMGRKLDVLRRVAALRVS